MNENFSSIQPINLLDVVMYGEIKTILTGSTNSTHSANCYDTVCIVFNYNKESYTFVFNQELSDLNLIVLGVSGGVIYRGSIELKSYDDVISFIQRLQSNQNQLGISLSSNNEGSNDDLRGGYYLLVCMVL
ncbi:MAG: hypothetical protein N2657_03540 [bacterium]|nr:hypothetical protein [bacterium]